MPRTYRRYSRRSYYPRKRYSNETMSTTGNFTTVTSDANSGEILATGQYGKFPTLMCVSPSNVQGIRKVKNFTLTISPGLYDTESNVNLNFPIRFVLVYVPEGQNASDINTGTGINSLYEPNQNVIMSGAFMANENFRIRSYLSRNLNSGDSIQLLMVGQAFDSWETSVVSNMAITLNYAIAY